MNNLFRPENPLMRFLSVVFDFCLLNLMALLCSIPILTAGASITALYRQLLHFVQKEESLSPMQFLRDWTALLRKTILPWSAFLAFSGLLLCDLKIFGYMPSPLRMLFLILLFFLSFCILFTAIFFFPMLAAGAENSFRPLASDAFRRAIAFLPRTICMTFLWLFPFLLLLFLPKWFITLSLLWFFLWFSLCAFLCVKLAGGRFAPHL